MSSNTLEYLIRLKDEFSGKMVGLKETGVAIFAAMVGGSKEFSAAFESGFNKIKGIASDGFGVLTGDYEKLGGLLGALPGPLGVVAGTIGSTLGAMISKFVDTTEAAHKLSLQTGASTEFLSGFKESAVDLRVNVESLDASLRTFSRNIGGISDAEGAAATGGQGLTAVFEAQGIQVGTYEQTLMALADRVKELGPGTEATRLATQAFGRAGADLIPILLQGSDAIAKLIEEHKELGQTISENDVSAVTALKAAEEVLADRGESLGNSVARNTVPALGRLSIAADLVLSGQIPLQNVLLLGVQTEKEYSLAIDKVTKAQTAQDAATLAANAPAQTYLDSLSSLGDQMDRFKQLNENAVPSIQEIAKGMSDTRIAALTTSPAWTDFNDITAETESTLLGNIAAEVASRNAMQSQASMSATATAALARYQAGIDAVTQSLGGSVGALDKWEIASTAYKLATGGLSESEFEHERAVTAIHDALTRGEITEQKSIDLLYGLGQGTLSARDAMEQAGPTAGRYEQELGKVEDAADKAGRSIKNIPTTKDPNITAHVYGMSDVEHLNLMIEQTQGKTVTVQANVTGLDQIMAAQRALNDLHNFSPTPVPHAAGGPVYTGIPYLVGERGPELFVPSTSGAIVPNDKVGAAASVVVNQYINASSKIDAEALAYRVAQIIQRRQ